MIKPHFTTQVHNKTSITSLLVFVGDFRKFFIGGQVLGSQPRPRQLNLLGIVQCVIPFIRAFHFRVDRPSVTTCDKFGVRGHFVFT